jgi:hypothetical protein
VIEYFEHPTRATAWRDGRFVVHPDAEAEDCTVWFRLPDGPVGCEGLLARRTGPTSARICAVPLWIYDVHLGDEVETIDSAEGTPVATGLRHDAGQHTFRVRFEDAGADDPRWQGLQRDLEPTACWFDVLSPAFMAVSAPPQHASEVDAYLTRRTDAGDLDFERGRSRRVAE